MGPLSCGSLAGTSLCSLTDSLHLRAGITSPKPLPFQVGKLRPRNLRDQPKVIYKVPALVSCLGFLALLITPYHTPTVPQDISVKLCVCGGLIVSIPYLTKDRDHVTSASPTCLHQIWTHWRCSARRAE